MRALKRKEGEMHGSTTNSNSKITLL